MNEPSGKADGCWVSAGELTCSEQASRPRGLLGAVGALAEWPEFLDLLDEIYRQRGAALDRQVNDQ